MVLFNHFNATLNEVVQRFAFQHAVLQQCQVDELFNNLVVVGKASVNIVLLRFQRFYLLILCLQFVFFGNGDFFVFLAFLITFA